MSAPFGFTESNVSYFAASLIPSDSEIVIIRIGRKIVASFGTGQKVLVSCIFSDAVKGFWHGENTLVKLDTSVKMRNCMSKLR